MASGALFGGPAARAQSKNLVEFRAGKMFMKGKMVHADKRKGLVYVYQDDSDASLMHFCWKDRSKAKPESQDDLIIFPDDVEFKAVPQCTTGRVFVLKFKTSSRKLFFWMQEPKSDKDDEFCRKVNESLNNPPAPGSSRAGGGAPGGGGLGGLPAELAAGLGGGSDLQSLLGHMSQQELMQLLGNMGGMGVGGLGGLSALMGGRGGSQAESTPPSRVQSSPGPRTNTPQMPSTTPVAPRPVTAAVLPSQSTEGATGTHTGGSTAPAATSGGANTAGAGTTPGGAGSSRIQLSDLQNILSGMGGGAASNKEAIDLSKAVTPESMIPILANAEIQERLLPFLPEGEKLPRTEGELRNTITSPQFQQAMNSFSAALASGQLGPLMAQFNLGEDVANAAAQGDVEAFAKAMQSGLVKSETSEDAEMKDDEKKE